MSARIFAAFFSALAWAVAAAPLAPTVVFTDDFERGLSNWEIVGVDGGAVKDSGDSAHRKVLELTPNGDVLALVKGSEAWGSVRMEGDMYFPVAEDNYLGFAYNHTARNGRRDFGLIYIKGNDSYLQVNPHRDFNVSRLVYPELQVPLTGDAAIVTGTWQRFALEVAGPVAHLYVGPGGPPQVTFAAFEGNRGALGLQPRSVGAPVWVDNVVVSRIDRLSYEGPAIPARDYRPDAMVTEWQVAGPFDATNDQVARRPGEYPRWRAFESDARGAVITNRIVDSHGRGTVAYFKATVAVDSARVGELQLSTADDLALWVNGRFVSFVPRQHAAWFDFDRNSKHAAHRIPINLRAGSNDVVLRVRGGVYASGGFFARVVTTPAA